MLGAFARKIFGTPNDRKLKPYFARVPDINACEAVLEKMTDDELRARTGQFKERLAAGAKLDDLLVEAFATVREAAKRTLGQRHFDVQLVGGMVLHDGMIAEMKTGEGKTLVSTLPVYLNSLLGKGVHVVTVNDYLAKRDAAWMGQIYKFLGLSVGCITHALTDDQRRKQYACDVTYGTNNELGFDYLRDNMKYSASQMVQRAHHYAIVDEVDSILIDEARTPLIISGPTEDLSELYKTIDKFIPQLDETHYELDEKQRTVILTEEGNEWMENKLREAGVLTDGSLYDINNISLVHHINQALKAHKLFKKDRDYIVKDGKVVIIDEFTGRMMEGRRYSESLHQALEAKESVAIQPENQTLSSITFQNYFRLYGKLAGMTGTAATEAAEFMDIYKLDVVEVPTNLPVIRKDYDDEVYRTAEEKFEAILDLIEDCHKRGQPVLVGTVSIEKSEMLSEKLRKRKIKHNVLNARYHEQEAYIVAQAGVFGGVTIATNMAGRGTDIQLGGNADMRIATDTAGLADAAEREKRIQAIREEIAQAREKVLAAGGLYVIGTERHESRRIDNQLRGRSGRQGDPGASKFYLSLEDDLMRIFGSQRMDAILQRLGLKQGEAIIHPWVNKALETAQKKVEARNFDIRKNLLRFDNVMNDQRKTIFEQRRELMAQSDVGEMIVDMRNQTIDDLVSRFIPHDAYPEQWNTEELYKEIKHVFDLDLPVVEWAKEEGIADEEVKARLRKEAERKAAEKVAQVGPEVMRQVEKSLLIQTLDHLWREHILNLDHLRQHVGLRGYAQRDPLNEYKSEAFILFENMLLRLRQDVTRHLMNIRFQMEAPPPLDDRNLPHMQAHHANPLTGEDELSPQEARRAAPRVGGRKVAPIAQKPAAEFSKTPRNAPCPCGSGKKFKHCHGAVTV